MRKLGHGQSVMFCAPVEVDRQIRSTRDSNPLDPAPVTVSDVLIWVMFRTCSEIARHIPQWVQQGIDYENRRKGDIDFSRDSDVELLRKAWLQPATQTLEEMYGCNNHSINNVNISSDMRKHLEMLGVTTLRDAAMEEEQEREVSHEVEQQVQLQRPLKLPPAIHCLDTEVEHFVRSGIISRNSTAFLPLMSSFRSNSETLNPKNPWATQLLCTRDFATTTKEEKERTVITDLCAPSTGLSPMFDLMMEK